MEENQFSRTEILIGKEGLTKLQQSKVAVFGIGGVGSFVVEGLARAGVGEFFLIDKDNIDITNLNRQIHADHTTIGQEKVEVMKNRILTINPEAKVTAIKEFYLPNKSEQLINPSYSYIVDAVDNVTAKISLIEMAQKNNVPIISCMGTGNKLNPTMLEVADIYETQMCPLAKVMRKELKNRGIQKLKVVYSKEEPIKNNTRITGSISFVPSVAGLIIAGEVVKDLLK